MLSRVPSLKRRTSAVRSKYAEAKNPNQESRFLFHSLRCVIGQGASAHVRDGNYDPRVLSLTFHHPTWDERAGAAAEQQVLLGRLEASQQALAEAESLRESAQRERDAELAQRDGSAQHVREASWREPNTPQHIYTISLDTRSGFDAKTHKRCCSII